MTFPYQNYSAALSRYIQNSCIDKMILRSHEGKTKVISSKSYRDKMSYWFTDHLELHCLIKIVMSSLLMARLAISGCPGTEH